jgi:hypothetical protein
MILMYYSISTQHNQCSRHVYTLNLHHCKHVYIHNMTIFRSPICYYVVRTLEHTVTCIPIARQRLGKHIPAETNKRNNRTSIARQWISKHASLRTEAVFSAWSVQSGYKEVFSCIKWSEESSFGTPACRDMSLELNGVESSELAAAE